MQSILNFISAVNHQRNRAPAPRVPAPRARTRRPTVIKKPEGTVRSTPPSPTHKHSISTSKQQNTEKLLHSFVNQAETVDNILPSNEDRECILANECLAGSHQSKKGAVSLRSSTRNPFIFKRDQKQNLMKPSEESPRRRSLIEHQGSRCYPLTHQSNQDSEACRQFSINNSGENSASSSCLSSSTNLKQTESTILSPLCSKPGDNRPYSASNPDTPVAVLPEKGTTKFSFSPDPDNQIVGESGQLNVVVGDLERVKHHCSRETETRLSELTDPDHSKSTGGQSEDPHYVNDTLIHATITDEVTSDCNDEAVSVLNSFPSHALISTHEQKRYLTSRSHNSHHVIASPSHDLYF